MNEGREVERRRLLKWSLALTLLTILSVLFVDQPLARLLRPSAGQVQQVTGPAIHVVEVIFGFPISKFLTGAVLLAVAIVLFFFRQLRSVAWLLMFLSLAQLTTRLVAGVLKNVFLRPRPYESLESATSEFFTSGGSFPSGHAAHFWPLFFVAAVALPRWRIPLLLLATAVSVSRVAANDHYLGDVVASAALAAFVSYAYALWILPRIAKGRSDGRGVVQGSPQIVDQQNV